MFARRGLDKVNELAQLEKQSSSKATQRTRYIFKEATIKLSILVFKRSVFESRKKSRSVIRLKYCPSVKDLLQLASPRSPTEKLLFELFHGASAQYFAILETLTDTTRRPSQLGLPPAISDLESELTVDVYQVSGLT